MKNETKQQADFIKMLDQCRGSLMKVCLYYARLGGQDILNLYQDIVCELWESWPTFAGRSKANTWVTSIAIKVGAMKYRAHKRMPPFVELDKEVCYDIADETADPCHDLLYDLIERLDSDEDRQMLYLYLDKKRHKDIAQTFGISTASARQRIHRIIQKMIQLKEQEK